MGGLKYQILDYQYTYIFYMVSVLGGQKLPGVPLMENKRKSGFSYFDPHAAFNNCRTPRTGIRKWIKIGNCVCFSANSHISRYLMAAAP